VFSRLKRIRLVADAGQVARPVAISAVAIALAVYALVTSHDHITTTVLAGIILLIATGAMLQVSRAVRHLHRAQEQVRTAAARAERHYFKVLRRLTSAVEDRQPHLRARSRRIGKLAREIAEHMDMDAPQARLLCLAAQVHDIGLLSVSERILAKPARLAADEFRAVKRHPEVAYRILQPLTFLAEILPAVRYHHERMNGTGYPDGLAGEAIGVEARILAVADSYDAMTHDRPHRGAIGPADVLSELRRCSPAGYDPRCVDALMQVLQETHLLEPITAADGMQASR